MEQVQTGNNWTFKVSSHTVSFALKSVEKLHLLKRNDDEYQAFLKLLFLEFFKEIYSNLDKMEKDFKLPVGGLYLVDARQGSPVQLKVKLAEAPREPTVL